MAEVSSDSPQSVARTCLLIGARSQSLYLGKYVWLLTQKQGRLRVERHLVYAPDCYSLQVFGSVLHESVEEEFGYPQGIHGGAQAGSNSKVKQNGEFPGQILNGQRF